MAQAMIILTIVMVQAQPDESENVFDKYGMCKDDPCAGGSECCEFKAGNEKG